MKAYMMIANILNSKRQLIKSLFHFVLIFFMVYYVVHDFYGMYSNYAFFIHPYKYGNFDAIVYETTEKDLDEQFTKENIAGKASSSASFIECKFICGSKEFFQYGACRTVGLPGNDFQSMTDVALHGQLIKKDDRLLHNDDTIILSEAIAMRIGAHVGDTVYIQCYTSVKDTETEGNFEYHFDSDRKYGFKVGAIYRENSFIGRAVITIPKLKEIILENYPERKNQDNVVKYLYATYIRFYDLQKGLAELENYIPTHVYSYEAYGDDWKAHLPEFDYSSYKNYSESMLNGNLRRYQLRTDMLAHAENNTVINTNVILFKTILATVTILLLFINQNYKILKLNRKSFGILSSAGMRQRKVFFYIAVTSFVEQLVALLFTFLIMYTSYLIYARPEVDNIFTAFVTVRAYAPLVAGAVAASILSGIFAAWMVSKKKIQEALSAE